MLKTIAMKNPILLIKRAFRQLVESLPVISDFYYHHWLFPRNPNLYRGVFQSFTEATAAIPENVSSAYHHSKINDGLLQNSNPIDSIHSFKSIDYPVLVWLGEAFKNSHKIFDLGGSTGYGYYAYRKYISYPAELHWLICEVAEAVNKGNDLLQHLDSPGLAYTTDFDKAEGCQIFLTSGTLQYVEPSLAELLTKLQTKPMHLIVHHVPFYDGPEYITLQNLLSSYVPYKIQNRGQFIHAIKELGYELIDSWQLKRECRIPFHPNRHVNAYHGFYFCLPSLIKA
jgi:putative methyltransferase (TIGR04325 family)